MFGVRSVLRHPCSVRPCPRRYAGEGQPQAMVNLSRERHESLLESEMVHFARALEPHPITLQEILAHRNADVLRKFLLEELPIRFARRVELIERQPAWDRTPHLRQVRKVYADGFQMLRMVSQPEKDKFRRALQRITHRHDSVLKHVVRGTRHMKRSFGLSDDDANVFLNEFLTQRIGTDILTSQYLALTQPRGATSVIDPVCEPFVLVQEALSCDTSWKCAAWFFIGGTIPHVLGAVMRPVSLP